MIVDLSDAGARLKLDPKIQLPSEFILVLSRDGRLNRRCRSVWRDDDIVGVKFQTRESIGPRHVEEARRFAIKVPAGVWADDPADAEPGIESPKLVPEKEPAPG
jgi:hypothetical protein